jgi:protein TonB
MAARRMGPTTAESGSQLRWAISIALAIGLHAAVALALIVDRFQPPETAEFAGAVQVELTLLPAGATLTRVPVEAPAAAAGEASLATDQPDATETIDRPADRADEAMPAKEAEAAPPAAASDPPSVAAVAATAERAQDRVMDHSAIDRRGIDDRAATQEIETWRKAIVTQIAAKKAYPGEARARREQGTAILVFKIDRLGKVMASRVQKSSGSAQLDGAALSTIANAGTFPAAPPAMAGHEFEFTVPIRYKLR